MGAPMYRLAAALGCVLAAAAAHGGDLALRVEHEMTTVGEDGVTRTVRFAERLVRRDSESWVARVVPAVAHDDDEHRAGGREHKHMDISAASRWVTRRPDGTLQVRIVDDHRRVVFEVGKTDFANIGFDGRWTTANQLLDPQQVQRMKPSARHAPPGARWFEVQGATRVSVLWDEQEQYPRRIESGNAAGTRRSTLVAFREAMPSQMPWTRLEGFQQRDYSDLLD